MPTLTQDRRISFAGAHSHLVIHDRPGLPELRYRQFSDWKPGGPLIHRVLEIAAVNDKPAPWQIERYAHRPHRADMILRCDQGLLVEQTLAYLDAHTILALCDIHNTSSHATHLRWEGRAATEHLQRCDIRAHADGLTIGLSARMHEPWAPDSTLDLALHLGWTQLTDLAGSDGQWSAQLVIEPQASCRVACTLQFDRENEQGTRAAQTARMALVAPSEALGAANGDLIDWERQLPISADVVPDEMRRQQDAWNQFWFNLESPADRWTHPILTPSKMQYARGIWLWDSAFHIFALLEGGSRAIDLARQQIEVLLTNEVDGHIPREVWIAGANPETQAPGVLTWAAWQVAQRMSQLDTGHQSLTTRAGRDRGTELLAWAYPYFCRNHEWYRTTRDPGGTGLCQWQGCDSGWDTSPRWDEGPALAVDLNCWLQLDARLLAAIAARLDRPDDVRDWRTRANKLGHIVRSRLWNERLGLFQDRHPEDGHFIDVVTPATFWPMFTGIATSEQAERMVRILDPAHPRTLWTTWPLPCVSPSDPRFEPANYWRGPVWVNLNWLTILGLHRYGYHDRAERLRRRTLDLIAAGPSPNEYYHPLTGEPVGAPNYMWTGALYLVMSRQPYALLPFAEDVLSEQ